MDITSFVLGYKKGKASGGGVGGATVDPVHTVTFMSEDGSAVLYQRSVVDGDDCADVVARGLLAKPTKESTPQYSYTYSGWSMTSGGAASSSALSAVTEDRTVYAAFTEAVRYYTITYLDDDGSVLKTESLAYGAMPSYTPKKDGYTFQYWEPELEKVTGDATYNAQFIEEITLSNSSWSKISEISEAGLGASYFAVGDRKAVDINGTVGTMYINKTLYAYIIGFDHNSAYEGTGIHFGLFKSAESGGKDFCLVDGNYNYYSTSGTKYFSPVHWGETSYGGWAGTDMRYDVLGSTDVAPSGYGSKTTTSRTGYNPSETCATNPVANTLMAALPSDLRSTMKPMTKYSDNKGFGNEEAGVTASIDYLPLLAEFEVFGARSSANQYEQNKQAQYSYFASGNSKIKYQHNSSGTAAIWWTRSAMQYTSYMTAVSATGNSTTPGSNYSYGIAPIFKV